MTGIGPIIAAPVPTVDTVVLLLVITVGVLPWAEVPDPFAPAMAVLRGALQLGVILGGLPPLEDGRFRILACMALMAVGTLSALVMVRAGVHEC